MYNDHIQADELIKRADFVRQNIAGVHNHF